MTKSIYSSNIEKRSRTWIWLIELHGDPSVFFVDLQMAVLLQIQLENHHHIHQKCLGNGPIVLIEIICHIGKGFVVKYILIFVV